MSEHRIQYYASDLAYYLDIGEIVDMHVYTTESGQQILRIVHLDKTDSEFQTVKARKNTRKSPPKRASKTPREPAPKPLKVDGERGFLEKITDVEVTWKNKPMKRPDEW